MKDYKTKKLRNVCIIGHSGAGKTSLAEALLYYSKVTDRLGRIEEGNTVCDYDMEERKRKISISTAIAPFEWEGTKVNIIDTPGYFDFEGEMIEGLRAADIAMISVCGVSGIQVGTERAWSYVSENNVPRAFFINKLDRENSSYERVLSELKDNFGVSVVPIQYPIGSEENFKGIINVISRTARILNSKNHGMEKGDIPKELIEKVDECKNMIIEAVAETDEKLLDKYLGEGTLSEEEIYNGLIRGCSEGEIAPVMCGSAYSGIGMSTLLEDIIECFPSPEESKSQIAIDLKSNKERKIKIDENGSFSAFVFKTIADPFVGKLSLFRVMTGKIKQDTVVYNSNREKQEKIGNMYYIRGKEEIQTNEIIAGDIGAVPKLQYTTTGDTLCDEGFKIKYEAIVFPKPMLCKAISTTSKGDEDKISSGLHKLLEEDPTFELCRNTENAETIISGLGATHLEIIGCKLKNKFGVEIDLRNFKIPYRETIKKSSDAQGKHKKQSGGHGQYGDVKIKFEPRVDGSDELEFVDEVVGGVVPRQYIPAVEKGLRECVQHGVLAGYPVIRLRAILHDGSYHPVDSSEMAFKIAASLSYKKGLKEAEPVLLEPIMHVEIFIPEDYMGEIMADVNKKRGRILGMESHDKNQKIVAEIPQSELLDYATDLKSMTGARGSFVMSFQRYEEIPENEAVKIIEEASKVK